MSEEEIIRENESRGATRRRGLGRGLDALFEDTEVRRTLAPEGVIQGGNEAAGIAPGNGPLMVDIGQLEPCTYQPRQVFDDAAIDELASSIRHHGVIQPLLVRPKSGQPGRYEIIAGERRWRAAQRAQRHSVPVVVNATLDNEQVLQLALVENLQRENLNAVEEAMGYQRLIDEFGYTIEKVADMLGRSRSHISNTLRLLSLPSAVLDSLREKKITAGHARALVGVPDPQKLLKEIIDAKLSVRETEKRAAKYQKLAAASVTERDTGMAARRKKAEWDMHLDAVEHHLQQELGLKVMFKMTGPTAGQAIFEFKTIGQLNLLLARLSSDPRGAVESGGDDQASS